MASKRKLEEKKKRVQQRKREKVKVVIDRLMGSSTSPKDRKWGKIGTEV